MIIVCSEHVNCGYDDLKIRGLQAGVKRAMGVNFSGNRLRLWLKIIRASICNCGAILLISLLSMDTIIRPIVALKRRLLVIIIISFIEIHKR